MESDHILHTKELQQNEQAIQNEYRIDIYQEAKVLVVEDNEINQEVLKGILEMFGIYPALANTGAECLDHLGKNKFDLIFMDIQMPEMDGLDATIAIRNCGRDYRDIPIVAMTSNREREEVEQYYNVGMNECLSKPINFELISKILNKYLFSFIKENPSNSGLDCTNTTTINEIHTYIPGVNVTDGIIRFGGKSDAYYRSISSFANDLNLENMSFEDFVSSENIKENAKFIHTLKGVSGNLSVEEIFEKTVILEKNLLNGTLDRNMFHDWVDSCTQVKHVILEVCSSVNENKGERIGSLEELNVYLTVLHSALVRYSVSDCDEILDVLRGISWGNEPDEFLEYLYKAIEDYEFDLAINLLRKREQLFSVPIEC